MKICCDDGENIRSSEFFLLSQKKQYQRQRSYSRDNILFFSVFLLSFALIVYQNTVEQMNDKERKITECADVFVCNSIDVIKCLHISTTKMWDTYS